MSWVPARKIQIRCFEQGLFIHWPVGPGLRLPISDKELLLEDVKSSFYFQAVHSFTFEAVVFLLLLSSLADDIEELISNLSSLDFFFETYL
jgi:hypothetical protein